jgi:carotenoid cleavage dioxygenase-like enzyme
MDYDVIQKTVHYYRFSTAFDKIKKIQIKTEYIPIIHDFAVFKNKFIILDAPFKWDWTQKIPAVFDRSKPSYIYLYDNTENILRKTQSRYPGFYIFHYADIEEINSKINIYASLYDNIDFSSMDISGKYRKIIIQRDSFIIHKNPVLENMNLDFPKKWRSYVILRGIKDRQITEFIVCKGLTIITKIKLPENRFFCGEHSIVEIEGRPYLVGFSYDGLDKGYICIIGVFTEEYAEQEVEHSVTIGFHSIFLSGSSSLEPSSMEGS